jgi:clan AA aspartic protease (TIGR02281 family)
MAFTAGWLRDSWYLSDAPKFSKAMPALSLEADTGGAQDGAPNVLEPAAASKLRPINGPAPQTDGLAEFKAMLDQREYKGAVEFYQASRYAEEHAARILKPVLLQDDFTQLTERYLGLYYDDVDVLLSLALFNRSVGAFVEAAEVYHLLQSYAYNDSDRAKVESAIDDFISFYHPYFVTANNLQGLEHLYEQMLSHDLLQPKHRLGQAEALLLGGHSAPAKELLLDLLDDPAVHANAQQMLIKYETLFEPEQSGMIALQSDYNAQVPLRSRGNQFVTELQLDNTALALLIDTGASLTTLSRQSFEQISDRHHFTLLGHRMFRTANGFSKGAVYRVGRMRLGQMVLIDMNIAVLDFSMGDDIDGLLGMNVLGQFRFQIDQQQKRLYLAEKE